MLGKLEKSVTFASANKKMVPWMSGLVTGLQNRLRRFESARHLLERGRRRTFPLFAFTRTTQRAYIYLLNVLT